MKAMLERIRAIIRERLPLGLRTAVRFYRNHRYIYLPQLRAPQTFNEHVHVRKLYDGDDRFAVYSDKLRVKDIVARVLDETWLIPTLWSGQRCPEQFPGWTLPFVLKANFGSGFNRFVRGREELNWAELRRVSDEWTTKTWPYGNAENWYNAIPRQLLAEPIIGSGNLPDYKFFVFGGEVAYIQVDRDRFGAHRRTFFSPHWQRQAFSYGYPLEDHAIPPPRHLREMLRAACLLGQPFAFARIDLYDLPDGPKFGEVTFSPAMGFKRFHPFAIDVELGKLWSAAEAR